MFARDNNKDDIFLQDLETRKYMSLVIHTNNPQVIYTDNPKVKSYTHYPQVIHTGNAKVIFIENPPVTSCIHQLYRSNILSKTNCFQKLILWPRTVTMAGVELGFPPREGGRWDLGGLVTLTL